MNELLPVVYFLGEQKALLIPGAPGERSTKVTLQTPTKVENRSTCPNGT